ncbi:short transient receptor potential channel 5-like [Orbicella faveolata]|uniref:short transient receptor potential channel 5-like n=1 Tax=Orbicella faveolata TaxID=48498 RepID=UPI0009E46931|nr:short transient receptor potential channel 5-like [Orbicella faveolata]
MALILSSLIITKSHEVDTDARLIHIFLFVTSSLLKTSWQLVLSVFSQTDLQKLESPTSFTTDVVAALYLIFLVLSVIMLINMLVALLNHTYDNVKTNAEVEWKFARAVVENQYRNLHCIVVPFNLLTVPIVSMYFKANGNSRQEDADNRRKEYRTYYHHRLFPLITGRYKKKYGGSFPLSVEEKIDLMMEKLQISPSCVESALENQVSNIVFLLNTQ